MAREKGSVNCHNYSFDSGIGDDVLGCIRMNLLLTQPMFEEELADV